MAATFHPQVQRGGRKQLSTAGPADRGSAAAAGAPTASSTSSTSAIYPPQPPSSSPLPIHGLQLDAAAFPLHPQFASSSHGSSTSGSIRLISAAQYAHLAHQHASIKLPDERVLFPWLHGADIPYSAQAENFGYRDGAYSEVPRYRGMVTVASHGPRSHDENLDHVNTQSEDEDEGEDDQPCESIYLDPSCQKSDSTLPSSSSVGYHGTHHHGQDPLQSHSLQDHLQSDSTHDDHPSSHARNPTSASIATSFSTDSFSSSGTHASTNTASSSGSSSGLASSASSVYSCDRVSSGVEGVGAWDGSDSKQTHLHHNAMTRSLSNSIDEEENALCDLALGEHDLHGQEERGGLVAPASSAPSSARLARHADTAAERIGEMEANDHLRMRGGEKDKRARFGPEEYTCLLVNSHHPHEILAYDEHYDPTISTQPRPSSSSYSSTGSFSSSEYDHKLREDVRDGNDKNDDDHGEDKDAYEEEGEDDDSKYVCFQTLPIPVSTVSFRHFRLQRYKYFTISDFFIYHPSGIGGTSGPGSYSSSSSFSAEFNQNNTSNRYIIDLAKKLSSAIKKMKMVRLERGERNLVDYNVYVITEPFEIFEKHYPHLVAVDSKAYSTPHKINFEECEHHEMRKLTKASLIGENVYLGNTFDVPLSRPDVSAEDHGVGQNKENIPVSSPSAARSSFSHHRSQSSLSSISSASIAQSAEEKCTKAKLQEEEGKPDSSENPLKFSICIEGRDMAAMCSTRHLSEREAYLNDLQVQIERERAIEEACKRKTLESLSSTSVNFVQHGLRKSNRRRKNKPSAFWFSSASSSSEEDGKSSSEDSQGESDETDHIIDAYHHHNQLSHHDREEGYPNIVADLADGQQEVLYDSTENPFDRFEDGDITLSPGTFTMALDEIRSTSSAVRASLAQTNGKCVSPPPSYEYTTALSNSISSQVAASNRSTPIKLQYKKSKSLRLAREAEELKVQAENKAKLQAPSKNEEDASKPREVLKVATEEIIHMECLSSAQSFNQASIPAMVDSIVEYVVWLRVQARPHLRTSRELQKACALHHQRHQQQQGDYHKHSRQQAQHHQRYGGSVSHSSVQEREEEFKPMARRVLIHCTDGYTDSSVLALSYVMYDQAISLPQAYLYLQNDCQRSFFVYPSDVAFLQAIERRLSLVISSQGRDKFNDDVSQEAIDVALAREREEKEIAEMQANERTNHASAQIAGEVAIQATKRTSVKSIITRPSLFSRSSSKDSTGSTSTLRAGSTCTSSLSIRGPAPTSKSGGPLAPTPARVSLSPASALQQHKEDVNAVSDAWFHSEHFDGHFPSRILDYLYLGNLSHASNALMLKQLGITHVLSVGESALVPPSKQCPPSSPSSAARARTPTNSLWLEHSLGNIQVMDVQDINDDGVDSILPHLLSGIEFIEHARAKGGKVLVHCRVGVSRSATIVIAQVMMDLDMSLAQAYLMVRARRLNILIQPTILFMHTLWTWEEEIRNLKKKTKENENSDQKFSNSRSPSSRICWPVLATEIADLNYKYLNC